MAELKAEARGATIPVLGNSVISVSVITTDDDDSMMVVESVS